MEFGVKFIPKVDQSLCSWNIFLSIHLKENSIVWLAQIHKHGILMVLPLSKQPISTQRMPTGELSLLLSLVKIKFLICNEFINKIHPVRTSSDEIQQEALKHSCGNHTDLKHAITVRWQTDRQWKGSPDILPSEFCLHEFGQTPPAISGFMREHLDPVVKSH